MVQMSPHSQNIEVSVKHLKQSNNINEFCQINNNFSQSNFPQNSPSNFQQVNNNYDCIVNEIEGFITQNDLNQSIGEESISSHTSMEDIMQHGAVNPFDDLLSSIDTNCQIKNEAYDSQFNIYMDNTVDYQQFYGVNNNNNIQQNMLQNTISFQDNQTYSGNFINTQNLQNQGHITYKSNSLLPCTSNLLDINSIKQENILENQSESSYCSSNETYDMNILKKDKNFQNKSQTIMSASSYKNMSKQSRMAHEKRYGPIVVRPRKNPAPTLASGRKSKYTVLAADEERKREIRRSRNRQAAEKCKQKRGEIEEQLEERMKYLENEKTTLSNTQAQLNETKIQLEIYLKQHSEQCTNHKTSTSISTNIYQNSISSNSSSNSNIYSQNLQNDNNLNIEYNNLMNSTNMSNLNTSNLVLNNSNTSNQYGNNNMVPYYSTNSNEQIAQNSSYIQQNNSLNNNRHIIVQPQLKSLNHQQQQASYNY